MLGVFGDKLNLPDAFPVEINGNSGDMVHSAAPFRMFPDAVSSHHKQVWSARAGSFRQFVNENCTALVCTFANILRTEVDNSEAMDRLTATLRTYDVPIVIFGMGVQASSSSVSEARLNPGAVRFLEYVSTRATHLGVRGEFTADVVARQAGVKNAYVTGRPSLYSSPQGLDALMSRGWDEAALLDGRPAVNVTNLARPSERALLANAIAWDHFLIEPVSRTGYEFHRDLLRGSNEPSLPYYFKSILKDPAYPVHDPQRVRQFYANRFKLFRNLDEWSHFAGEVLSFSYGTRFHGNMETLLAGRPALWFTHDSRTSEMVDYFKLPSLPLKESSYSLSEVQQAIDFEPFFKAAPEKFARFAQYLEQNGLPAIALPEAVAREAQT